MIEQEDTGLELTGAHVDKDAKIHPFVMKQINALHDRLETQNATMQAMWSRMRPLDKFHEWVKETHPDLLEQYVSIRELEELGKTNEWEKMARGYGAAPVKAAGQAVSYGDGNL
jgi:hypothetical protein